MSVLSTASAARVSPMARFSAASMIDGGQSPGAVELRVPPSLCRPAFSANRGLVELLPLICERHAAHSLTKEEEDHEGTLAKFRQKRLQMVDSFLDASRLVLRKIEAMYEAQGDIVGFLCILNFVLPGSCAA